VGIDRLDPWRRAGVLGPQVLVELGQRPPLKDLCRRGCNTALTCFGENLILAGYAFMIVGRRG
jgi:hypothetical protein